MTGENRGRGRPRKTESTYADTRNDLIRSGLELLTQNGFLATGVDAIVKNANVPKGSFYYYFKSKEDYAQTVLNAYDSFFEHKLKKHLHESSCTPMVRLENFINDACEGIKKYNFTRGCLVGNMMQESPGLPQSFIKVLQNILESWQALVAACGMAQGMDLMGNMAPFILRGVTLKGIDSVMFAKEKRAAIWQQAV